MTVLWYHPVARKPYLTIIFTSSSQEIIHV